MTRRKMYVPIMNRNEKKILIKLFKNGYIVENEPFCRNDDSDVYKRQRKARIYSSLAE